jgi:hypothetical protein
MTIRLINARKLAEELGRGQITSRQKALYLFTSFALWLIIYATGFTVASPLWSWMSVVEAVASLLITALGFTYAYEAAGGDENPDFVVQFTCLYVPVGLTTAAVIWAMYWGVVFGFRESLISISESRLQVAINLSRIGSSVMEMLVTLSIIAVQALTFYRVTRLLGLMQTYSKARDS